jgi:hypothetical protein
MSTFSCKKQGLVTQSLLKELLELRCDGKFYWKISRGRAKVGDLAGYIEPDTGYRVIGIRGALHAAHRLAILWRTGEWPKNFVTHIDKDRDNNWPDNLVDTSPSVIMQNRKGGRGGLPKGVKRVRNSYTATIVSGGVEIHLGTFLDPALAIDARVKAERKYHTILGKKDDTSK